MPAAAFATLGCKVNQYETQRILDSFEERGFAITEFNQPADVYVINTCSVTVTAERKSRQMARRLARQNPNGLVVMTGCGAEMARIRGEGLEEAALVVPNPEKLRTVEHVLARFPELAQRLAREPAERPPRPAGRTRATLKVQDGCNVFCTFCSIPHTRGVMASRPADEVLEEARQIAARGCLEIVVTGVLVGAYGPATGSGGADLAELLRRLAAVPGIERVRLSSIEPTQVSDRLLAAFAEEPRLCRHLHVPLQSGNSAVLQAMNRPYDQRFYLDLCRRIQARLPGVAITTDILVGFPGEDQAAFEQTVQVVREVGFARAHIFRYSPRPGTPAAARADQVPDQEKEERSRHLAEVCRETQQRYIAGWLGQTVRVLVEGREREGGLLSGYSENYIRVLFAGGSHLAGRVVPIRLLEATCDGAVGEASDALQPEADFIPITLARGMVDQRRAGLSE